MNYQGIKEKETEKEDRFGARDGPEQQQKEVIEPHSKEDCCKKQG